jgi:hypothetical protein
MKSFSTRVLLGLLLTLSVTTAIAFSAPDLVLIGLFFFILPGLILFLSPTFLLYLVIFAVPWLALRSANKRVAVAAGVAAALAVAFGVPIVVNQQTVQALDAAARSDIVPATPIAPARTIALLPDQRYNPKYCTDLCALLLYNGVAERIIPLGPPEPWWKPTVFRLERRASCDAAPLADRRVWTTDERTADAIADAVRLRVAAGECLIAEPLGDSVPDLTITHRVDVVARRDQDHLALPAGRVDSDSIEVTAGGTTLARIAERRTTMLLSPLFLNLPMSGGGGGFDIGEWEWGRRDSGKLDLDVLAALGRLTSFDLSIPGSAALGGTAAAVPSSTGQLRQHIDDLLDDASIAASDGRFALLADYYRILDETAVQPGDAERLARIIAAFPPLPARRAQSRRCRGALPRAFAGASFATTPGHARSKRGLPTAADRRAAASRSLSRRFRRAGRIACDVRRSAALSGIDPAHRRSRQCRCASPSFDHSGVPE